MINTMETLSHNRESIPLIGRSREPNPNIELPTDEDSIPLPPDQEHGPPIETPPDQPGTPENQPDPPPIKEPDPNGPIRLI